MTLPSTTEEIPLKNQTNMTNVTFFIAQISIVVSIFGIFGNSLVIYLLSFKIKRNSSTVYIMNLALADLMFLLILSTVNIVSVTLGVRLPLNLDYEDSTYVDIILSLAVTCLFGYNASLSLLSAISVERCLCVLFPVWYRCSRPRHQSSAVCIIIWIISCLLTIVEFYFCYLSEYYRYYTQLNSFVIECKVVFMIIWCLSFIVFIPLMIVSSFVLLIKIWTTSLKKQPPKLYIVITVTVIFFIVFGMPMRILLLIWYKKHSFPPFPSMDILSLFSCINSSINPFVYFLVGRQGTKSGKFNLIDILQAVFRAQEPTQQLA
ncbi:hypothetical protein GDO86_006208 [Hymenochirus boettgeri]|uniref:G-protein coupled receptors family 1 profile domain-containing protein n=1 Tax=Hymenochirus boettgeri TaxID=247094 RepID=A0A8T2JD44_9PIPI|nr:hypothetical protein GDO86_006208 [Hymenochirus boettgeri]